MAESERQEPTNYTGVIIGAIAVAVLFLFSHFGKSEMGLSASICMIAILFAIGLRWNLRKRFWFWEVIVLVTALHVPLILMFRWPDKWVPGIALLPIGAADLLIFLGAVRFVEKFIVKAAPPDDEA